MEKTTPLYTLKKLQSEFPVQKLSKSKDSYDFIRQFYLDDISIFESFFMVTLDAGNKTTGYFKISQGGITGTVVDIKILAKYAIENLATSVIIAHNHPSGKLTPSEQDKNLTQKIKRGLDLLDIKLLDHLIVTENSFYSFLDEGIL